MKIDNINKVEEVKIDISEWMSYNITDIFDLKTSIWSDPNKYKEGNIPYVSRQIPNNGIKKFISTDTRLYEGNCITIGAESAVAYFQSKPFKTGEKVYRLYLKEKQGNRSLFLYFCTILTQFGEKYHYNNMWSSSKIKEDKIKLPSILNKETLKYEPNWEYMENYITDLENTLNKSEKFKTK